ncbi:unnamed protein product, partial [Amoebophrya sp. A120]|eukprot:GSA120T00010974001.1
MQTICQKFRSDVDSDMRRWTEQTRGAPEQGYLQQPDDMNSMQIDNSPDSLPPVTEFRVLGEKTEGGSDLDRPATIEELTREINKLALDENRKTPRAFSLSASGAVKQLALQGFRADSRADESV